MFLGRGKIEASYTNSFIKGTNVTFLSGCVIPQKLQMASQGDKITTKMITTVEVGGYNLPSNIIYKEEDIIGKYANTDLYKGDYVMTSKLSDTPQLKNE